MLPPHVSAAVGRVSGPQFFETNGATRLLLAGRSGCSVEIINENGPTFVRKASLDVAYSDRLLLQAAKQKSFVPVSVFVAPKVVRESAGSYSSFDMEYIPGEKYTDFFCRLSKTELDQYIGELLSFIDRNLARSILREPDHSLFRNKLATLQSSIDLTGELDFVFRRLRMDVPHAKIPIGYCHGDFTFSNMVFCNGRIFLVDFLDSFIDSPLVDIVKLRQDTCFKWTLMIDPDPETHKLNKSRQILNYMDSRVREHYRGETFYREWYSYLQTLNLLRILPYLGDETERDFVLRCLKEVAL